MAVGFDRLIVGLQIIWRIGSNFDATCLKDGLLVGDQVAERRNFNADLLAGLLKCLLKARNVLTISAKIGSDRNALPCVCFGTVNQFDACKRFGCSHSA